MTVATALINDAKASYEAALVEKFGLRPINVFTRLRYMLELSHSELASRMYTTKITLIRLEQGCFDRPLPIAVNWWLRYSDANDLGLTELALTDQYEDFQSLMRQRHYHFFGEAPIFDMAKGAPHPLKQLRANTYNGAGCSVNEVAKALCINQSTVQHWEKKWRTQKSVPGAFQSVLMEIGYSKYFVIGLNDAYFEWRANQK